MVQLAGIEEPVERNVRRDGEARSKAAAWLPTINSP
jgi:hypothetical protein